MAGRIRDESSAPMENDLKTQALYVFQPPVMQLGPGVSLSSGYQKSDLQTSDLQTSDLQADTTCAQLKIV